MDELRKQWTKLWCFVIFMHLFPCEAKSLCLAQKPKTEHMVPIADEAAFTYHIEVEASFATVIEYVFVRRILVMATCSGIAASLQ